MKKNFPHLQNSIDFQNNVQKQFLNIETPKQKAKTKAESFKVEKPENKSKRLNLVIKPSLYKDLQETAKSLKISTNELIHQVLTDFIKKSI